MNNYIRDSRIFKQTLRITESTRSLIVNDLFKINVINAKFSELFLAVIILNRMKNKITFDGL